MKSWPKAFATVVEWLEQEWLCKPTVLKFIDGEFAFKAWTQAILWKTDHKNKFIFTFRLKQKTKTSYLINFWLAAYIMSFNAKCTCLDFGHDGNMLFSSFPLHRQINRIRKVRVSSSLITEHGTTSAQTQFSLILQQNQPNQKT